MKKLLKINLFVFLLMASNAVLAVGPERNDPNQRRLERVQELLETFSQIVLIQALIDILEQLDDDDDEEEAEEVVEVAPRRQHQAPDPTFVHPGTYIQFDGHGPNLMGNW
jgi:hypothetical protein